MRIMLIFCIIFVGALAVADNGSCSLEDKKALISVGYSQCSIQEYCGSYIERIRGRTVDVKNKEEAIQLVEKMRGYGCQKVAVGGQNKDEKGRLTFNIISSDCALTGSHQICEGFSTHPRIILRKGANVVGDKDAFTQVELCLSDALQPKVKSKVKASRAE